jgi:hypothetical protein
LTCGGALWGYWFDTAQPPRDHAFVTTKPKAAAAARIGAALAARERGELLALLRPCFVRVDPWLQAGKYVGALVRNLPKRNGWTVAQWVGDQTPLRTQRLLNRAVWDTFAAMGTVRRFAVAGLDEAARRGRRLRGLAFHYCFLLSGQAVSKSRLIRAAGLRWPVEEDFEFGKDCFGLDQSQVRPSPELLRAEERAML